MIHHIENSCKTKKNSFIPSPDFSYIKHLQIFTLVCKTKTLPMLRPSVDQFVVKINGIDDNGKVLGTMKNILVNLTEIADVIIAIVSKKQRFRLIKSNILLEMNLHVSSKRSDKREYLMSQRSDNQHFQMSQYSQTTHRMPHILELSMTPYNNTSQIQHTNHHPMNYYNQDPFFDKKRHHDWNY